MNYKNFTIATLVATIIHFLLGWLFYGILFTNIYTPEPGFKPNLLFVFLGSLFYVAMIAYIFIKWAGISNWVSGLKAGTLIGLLYGLSMNFYMYSNKQMCSTSFAQDVFAGVVMTAVIGAVIAYINGMLDKK